MRVRIIVILFLIGTISCNNFRRSWADYIAFKFSNNIVYWAEDQKIIPDLFKNEEKDYGSYSDYFGFIVLWKIGDTPKLNLRIYFDKGKSWMKPESEWVNYSIMPKSKRLNYQGKFSQVPKLLKLKFDYLEYGARQFRKYFKENPGLVSDDNIRGLVESQWNKSFDEWIAIQEELGDNISDDKLKPIRDMVDQN